MISVNPIDRKLMTILKALLKGPFDGPKREKVGKEFRDVRARVVDAELGRILDDVFAEYSGPPGNRTDPTLEQTAKRLGALRARGLVETAAFLFAQSAAIMAMLKLDEVLPLAPDVTSFELWRKVVKVSAIEIETRLLADLSSVYVTAGADWLLLRAKPEQLMPLFEMLLCGTERPNSLATGAEALAPTLKKDKRGILLEKILHHTWPDKSSLAKLAEAVRLNRTLLKMAVEKLPPILCKKDAPETGLLFTQELFGQIHSTQGTEREFVTAALARLGCGILLQERRGPVAEAILGAVAQTVKRLRNVTREEALRQRTWVFENLNADNESVISEAHVTITGARYLALAFEKAGQGFAANDILSVTARNLGLKPIGNQGEAANYNPIQHEDMEGGMLPGDAAHIAEPGWALGADVVVRAKVKKGVRHV